MAFNFFRIFICFSVLIVFACSTCQAGQREYIAKNSSLCTEHIQKAFQLVEWGSPSDSFIRRAQRLYGGQSTCTKRGIASVCVKGSGKSNKFAIRYDIYVERD